jgi:glutamate synthase (NADPH/NADH) small chain
MGEAVSEPNRVGPFPFSMAEPNKRSKDFSEVELPYTTEQAVAEAERCLLCGNPVCIDACPVQMDVRGMFEAVARNDFKTAYIRIRETNMLLGTTGRCCPQLQGLCEDACVMRWEGQPLSIGMVQRFVQDWERDNRLPDPAQAADTGKHVSIVGAGPAGLAAAEFLRRFGHSVTIYEELLTPGGTAWYGVPDYHLPKDVLLYEIDRVKGMGVEIKTGVTVGKDITLHQLLDEGADAVLVTTGPKDVVKLNTPGVDLKDVYDGYAFIKDVFVNGVENYLKNPRYNLGDKVFVIGGGDSSLDCARTALRLTNGTVTLVYHRTEKEMPSYTIMVDQAKAEGVQFKFLAEAKSYNDDNGNGHVSSITMDTMRLGQPDQTGRRRPEPVPGKEFKMGCTSVFLVIGRGPNSFLQKKAGLKMGKHDAVVIDDHFRTSMDKVFAAGDVTEGETLIVKAMGAGRNAAQRIHEYLTNSENQHVSLYERYFIQNSYQKMLHGGKTGPPPP